MTDDPTPTTPPPGGQPQALTDDERQWGAESDAYLRALLDAHTPSKQHGDEKFTGRCMHCSYTIEPCDTASAAAAALVRSDALDEARSEIMRLQDNDSAYDVGYQRADAAAGAVIDRLRQERDDAQARAAHFESLATDQQRLNEAMVASLRRGLAQLEASEAELARLRQVLESQRVPHRYGGWERTREGYRVWCPCGWEHENTSAARARAAVDSHLNEPLAATDRGRAPEGGA
jgi:hypothetical protein